MSPSAHTGTTRRALRRVFLCAAFLSCLFHPSRPHSAHNQQPPPPKSPALGSFTVNPKPEDVKRVEPAAPGARSAIRIIVKDAEGKPIQRKRFFLLQRSVLDAGIDWEAAPRREDFLAGASPELRAWLARHDCDTLYCPEYEAEFASARETVPEFRRAYAEGLRRYKNERTALRWITVNFPLKNLRTGFYEKKKVWTEDAARKAGLVASVMTDEKGEAYFAGVELKDYFVSNLFPLERANLVWNALVRVPALLPGKRHSVSLELTAAAKQP